MNADKYAYRKEHNICVYCGEKPPVPGKTMCEECAEKERLRNQGRYKKMTGKPDEEYMTYSELLKRYCKKDNHRAACIIAELIEGAPEYGVAAYIEQRLGEIKC